MHLPRENFSHSYIHLLREEFRDFPRLPRVLVLEYTVLRQAGIIPQRSVIKELLREVPYVRLLSITDVQRARAGGRGKKKEMRRPRTASETRSRHRRRLSWLYLFLVLAYSASVSSALFSLCLLVRLSHEQTVSEVARVFATRILNSRRTLTQARCSYPHSRIVKFSF